MESGQKILIKEILAEGIEMGASDLHFSVGNYPILRVGEDLRYLENREIITEKFMEDMVASLLTPVQQQKLNTNKDIVLSYLFDRNLRFKVTIFHQRGFLSAAMRYIPAKVPSLLELKLDGTIKKLTGLKNGLVVIAGSFGSGRSSTAAAMIEEINHSRKSYILTVEDPIEYVFNNDQSIIEQREVGVDANNFAEALKHFQEQDGDVLFLDELSGPEVIYSALSIASGNSLVITTMTADSAAKAISSILNSFSSIDEEKVRGMLADALKAVVCQKMLPKVGGGAMAVCEILLNNDSVKSTITSGKISQLSDVIKTSRQEGMVSFNQALASAVSKREISAEDALANSSDPQGLEKMIGQ